MKVVYEWLKDYIGKDIPSLEKIEELLTFHSFEIEGLEKVGRYDVIDVDVLPNRSGDCLCHRGIAREIATLTGSKLAYDPFADEAALIPHADKIVISIENPQACRRFAAALVTNVSVEESPDWLKERLEALGQHSINNIVDATNYIMLSLGQPLHAYDAMKLQQKDGVWHFGVRMAHKGEMITALTGDEYKLDPSVQLIVDGLRDAPLGIAGIKGGAHAEIDENTAIIIIEAANFDQTITRKASQKLKLQTDASKRFENEISPETISYALREVVGLIGDITNGVCEGYADAYPTKAVHKPVGVSLKRIRELLNLSLKDKEVDAIFGRLGFMYTRKGEEYSVTAPFERTDITIAEDVIEEVGRIYGYEHVQSVMLEPIPLSEINARHYYSEKIRNFLASLGYSEVITSSFRKKDEIQLQNALASDKGCLRSSLKNNLIEVLDRNIQNMDILGLFDVRVFEIGTVFNTSKDRQGIDEHVSVALGVRTKQQGHNPTDDAILKETIEKLEAELTIAVNRDSEQGIVEFNLTDLLVRLPVPSAYEPYGEGADIQYRPYSDYPFVARDIALWVEEAVKAADVEKVLTASAGELRVRTTLFDEFKKDGRTSYAFRLVFQSDIKTLTDDEVNAIMDTIYSAVQEKGWEVR